jgi:hypothetical protein
LFMLVLLVGLTVADVGSREPPPLEAPGIALSPILRPEPSP